jgi:Tol biopolymer transport system component
VPAPDLLLCDRRPAFSPDGEWISYFHCPRSPRGDLWVIPAEGGEPRRLTFDDTFGGTPVWTPDGERIVYSSTLGGSRTLWQVTADGGEPEPLLQSAGDDTDPELSLDGSRLVFTNQRNRFRLLLVDPETGTEQSLLESRAMMFDASLSPAGDRAAYFGLTGSGGIDVFIVNVADGRVRPLTTESAEVNIHPSWSSDGRTLYYYRQEPAPSYRATDADGGISREIAPGWDRQTQNGARPDPAERRIVYTLMRGGQPVETRIRDIGTGDERVFPQLLRYPRWSADGTELVGAVPGDTSRFLGTIVVCEVDSGDCRRTDGWGAMPRWSVNGKWIYFLRWKSANAWEVWRVPARDGESEKVIDIAPVHPIGLFFDVAADGRILYIEFESGLGELWMVDLAAG